MRGPKTSLISILVSGLLTIGSGGAAAQEDEAVHDVPTLFTWVVEEVSDLQTSYPGSEDIPGGILVSKSEITATGLIEAGDPRASGVFSTEKSQVFLLPADAEVPLPAGVLMSAGVERLVNDGGSWSGRGFDIAGSDDDLFGAVQMRWLTGAEGYEGLTLILVQRGEGVNWGMIVPTVAVPQPPEPSE